MLKRETIEMLLKLFLAFLAVANIKAFEALTIESIFRNELMMIAEIDINQSTNEELSNERLSNRN